MYSKRQKELREEIPDTYIYDHISQPLKIQIIHILRDTLGNEDEFRSETGDVKEAYTQLVDILCREYGLFDLASETFHGKRFHIKELFSFILQQSDHEKILDVVELSFKTINSVTWVHRYLYRASCKSP